MTAAISRVFSFALLFLCLLLLGTSPSFAQADPAFALQIEKDEGQTGIGALQGQITTVDIDLIEHGTPLAGFRLVISYPKNMLVFQGLDLNNSVLINQCGWDEITVEALEIEDSSHNCLKGYIAIHGTADFGRNNVDDDHCAATGTIFSLRFLLSNDRTLECQLLPIRFAFVDCRSNLVWTQDRDAVWTTEPVEDPLGQGAIVACGNPSGPSEPGEMFPTEIAYPASCSDSIAPPLTGSLTLTNGGIQVICAGEIDGRGDLNLDGLPFTLTDRKLYEDYLLYGDSALFGPLTVDSILLDMISRSADVNRDGKPFTIADLVQIVHYTNGGSYPGFDQPTTTISYEVSGDGTLLVNDPIGGAYVVIAGEARFDVFHADVSVLSHYRQAEDLTYVVMYTEDESKIIEGPVLRSASPIVSVDLSAPDGNPTLSVEGDLLPNDFVLYQNYPNPFNPTTYIEFAVPVRTDYKLSIHNAAGQQVHVRQGRTEAGLTRLEWDATGLASGVYLYRVEALGSSQSRKMLLLK